MLELKSIRQALTLDEHLSIRRAAAHLGLQPSAGVCSPLSVARHVQRPDDLLDRAAVNEGLAPDARTPPIRRPSGCSESLRSPADVFHDAPAST